MKSGALVAAASGLTILAVVVLLRLREDEHVPLDPAAGMVTEAPALPAATLDLSAPAPAPAPQRTVAADLQEAAGPAAAPARGLRVQVIDGKDGHAVASARVWLGAEADVRTGAGEPFPGTGPFAAALARVRDRWTAQSTGVDGKTAPLPPPSAPRLVVVAADAEEAPRRLGWRVLDDDAIDPSKPLQVVIDARGDLTLRVRRDTGAVCAAVPLRLAVAQGSDLPTLWRGTTGMDGTAIVTDLVARARAQAPGAEFAALRVLAYVDAPLGKRPRAEIAPAAMPATPVDLVLPPTGSLRVDLDTAGAAPVRGGSANVEEVGLSADEQRLAPAPHEPLRERSARFPWVGLGLTLEVSVHIDGASAPRTVEAAGPIGPGEERRVVVPLVGERSVLVARLLDPEGKPVASAPFELEVKASFAGSTTSMSSTLHSDADARVRIAREDDLDASAERSIELRQVAEQLDVTLAVPKPWAKGETDLGDVLMQRPPLLVGGRVATTDGQPIADASVRVADLDAGDARTGADGRFAIRTRAVPEALTLVASARGFLPSAATTFVPGTADLEVRLAAAGVLRGELLLDRFDARQYLFVVTRERSTGATERTQVWSHRFELEHVVPGRYDVTVHVAGSAEVLAQASDVEVRPGATTEVGPLDLRGKLRQIAFRVLDENGAPVRDASALVATNSATSGRARFEGVLVQDGNGLLVATKAPVDLCVFAPGRHTEIARAVQDGQQITLRPVPVVTVRVPAAALPAAPLQVLVAFEAVDDRFPESATYVLRSNNSVRSTSGSRPWNDARGIPVDASGQARVPITVAGRQRVRCLVAHRTAAGTSEAEVEGVTPAEVAVRADLPAQVVDVSLAADAVARAAKKL